MKTWFAWMMSNGEPTKRNFGFQALRRIWPSNELTQYLLMKQTEAPPTRMMPQGQPKIGSYQLEQLAIS